MTKNSRVILDMIESSTCHPTAEEVYRMAYRSGNRMSISTVYNNLSKLCEEGAIRKLSNANQADRYDKTVRHDHLICCKCGRTTDLYLKDISSILEKEAGIPISSYDLKLIYECDDCKQKKNS